MSFWDLLKASSTFWNCLTLFGGCSWCQRVSSTFPLLSPPPAPPHPAAPSTAAPPTPAPPPPRPAAPRRVAPARPAPPNLRNSRRLIPPSIRVVVTLLLATVLYSLPACVSRSRFDL